MGESKGPTLRVTLLLSLIFLRHNKDQRRLQQYEHKPAAFARPKYACTAGQRKENGKFWARLFAFSSPEPLGLICNEDQVTFRNDVLWESWIVRSRIIQLGKLKTECIGCPCNQALIWTNHRLSNNSRLGWKTFGQQQVKGGLQMRITIQACILLDGVALVVPLFNTGILSFLLLSFFFYQYFFPFFGVCVFSVAVSGVWYLTLNIIIH